MALPAYRRKNRDTRRLLEEGSFKKGMYYTTNLVDAVTSRLLVNFDIKDGGSYMTPRLGMKIERNEEITTIEKPFSPDDVVPGPHVNFLGVYRDSDGLDKFGTITLSFGIPNSHIFRYYMTDDGAVDKHYYNQTYTNAGLAFGFIRDVDGDFHPINMDAVGDTRLKFYKNTPKPMFTVHNNKLYTIDGKSSMTSEVIDYTSEGTLGTYAEFPYDGVFDKLTISYLSGDIGPYRIETRGKDGSVNGEVVMSYDTRVLLSNGTFDYFSIVDNTFHQNIGAMNISDIMDSSPQIERLTNVTLFSFLKPEGSVISGSVEDVNFKTTGFSEFVEVNVADKTALNSGNEIGNYTTRVDATRVVVVFPLDTPIEVCMATVENSLFKYQLKKTALHTLLVPTPLRIIGGGSIRMYDIPSRVIVSAEYKITYKQPIYEYSGGLQEYSFTKQGTSFYAEPKPVVAKVPQISEATSVGFNMLLPNPYSFANKVGLVLRLMGIMPYLPHAAESISMSANLGEEIKFECFYEYVQGQKYFTKWEYLPLSAATGSTPIVLKEYGKNPDITGGDSVNLIVKASDAKFTLRVTVTPEAKDKPGTPDEILAKVIVYPIYETGNTYLKDISSYKYDLGNATGIGSYKNMLCLWGVPGADTTLFMSDIDDVSYFPFANNILSFNDKILAIQNYQGGLLIFTTASIYLLEGSISSKFEVTEMYQNLTFTKEDVASLKVIKNIIFIRSGNNYYTLVPNTYTGQASDVKLNTVSAPIKELVGDWESFLKFLGDTVFDFDIRWGKDTKIKQYDFFNYIDDGKIKNVYRFAIHETVANRFKRYQIDVSLIFDTSRGIWTVETLNLPFNECIPTDSGIYTSYARSLGDATKYYFQEVDLKNYNRVDKYNTTSYTKAYNDIHTSPREEELQLLPPVVYDKLVRVVDGDTIILEKLGSTRLLYIDAPEDTTVKEDFGSEATAYLRELLPVGSIVKVEFEGSRSDKYDRALGWIFNHEDSFVQHLLADFGAVKSVYAYEAYKYAYLLDPAIHEAWKNKVGYWAYEEGNVQYIYTSQTESLLPNYQVLDTGNKNHDVYLHKRYREFQFQINNKSHLNLQWYTRFYIDAVPMQDFRQYEINHDTDPLSTNYGIITVDPIDTANAEVLAVTYLNTWALGVNMFPDLEIVKVRLKISGKGTYPRLLVVSKNQANYDILSYAWVMRVMSYR